MEKGMLMQSTRKFLDDYLDDFVQENMMDDVRLFHFGREVPYGTARMFESEEPGCIEESNVHLGRFNAINRAVPEISRREFINAVAAIDDVVLVDIGSLYSSKMGLWVAYMNPDAKVIVYKKDVPNLQMFMPCLFDGDTSGGRFQLSRNIDFDRENPVKSINNLFRSNGFHNIELRNMFVGREELENIAMEAQGRPVVFYSERTPTVPLEMTHTIAGFVRESRNSGMILMPFINTPIDAYHSDKMMQKISKNQHVFWEQESGNTSLDTQENGKLRVFCAMHIYYALKVAALGNGEVYNATKLGNNPAYYASTIEPKKA